MELQSGCANTESEEMEKKIIVKLVQTYDCDWLIKTYPSDPQMPVKAKVNVFPIVQTKEQIMKKDLFLHVIDAESSIKTFSPDLFKQIHLNAQVNLIPDKSEIEVREESLHETETSHLSSEILNKIGKDSLNILVAQQEKISDVEQQTVYTFNTENSENFPVILNEEPEHISDVDKQSMKILNDTENNENFPSMSDERISDAEEQMNSADNYSENEAINFGDKTTLCDKKWKCKICRRSFSAIEYLQKHIESHACKQKYTCVICKKCFTEKYRLKIHMRIHTGERPFSCSICDKSYITRNHLNEHFMTHKIDSSMWCKICNIIFASKHKLEEHQRHIHLEKMMHFCKHCNNSYSGTEELSNHLDNCTSSCDKNSSICDDTIPYMCEICDRSYHVKENLERHMVRAHNEGKPYKCNVCSKSFAVLTDLRRHSMQHLKGYPYTCNMCHKSFKKETSYLLHLKTHARERELSCHLCKKQFPLKRLLYAHLEAHNEDYTEEDKFVCHVCGEMFDKSRELFAHLYEHNVSKAISSKLLKRYYCHFCKKGYARTYSLFKHIKIHITGNAPFVCDICKESFASKFELFEHFQIHDSVYDLHNPESSHVMVGKNLRS